MHRPFSRRRALLGLLGTALASSTGLLLPTLAQAASRSAKEVIEQMVTEALTVLRDPKLKDQAQERKRKLRTIADRAFDWQAMAMGSLGHHWRKLSEAERAEFVGVFKELIAKQYMDDVDRFRGNEAVQVQSAVAKEDLFLVKTSLTTSSGERVPMDYTLHQVAEGWMIEDLAIEGVSMVAHYRQTFSRFLVNKSFAELMEVLKRKLG